MIYAIRLVLEAKRFDDINRLTRVLIDQQDIMASASEAEATDMFDRLVDNLKRKE